MSSTKLHLQGNFSINLMNSRRNSSFVISGPFFYIYLVLLWKDDASSAVKICPLKNLAKQEAK